MGLVRWTFPDVLQELRFESRFRSWPYLYRGTPTTPKPATCRDWPAAVFQTKIIDSYNSSVAKPPGNNWAGRASRGTFSDSPKGHKSQWGREFLLVLWIKLGSNYCHGAEGVQLVQKSGGIRVLCRWRKVLKCYLGEIQSYLGNNVIGSWKIFMFLCALIFKLSSLRKTHV